MGQIDYILDEFPFDKVWQAMRAVGWKWGAPPGHYPTFTELRRKARGLLEWAARDPRDPRDQTRIQSGGFEAMYVDGVLELNFVLASASNEDAYGDPLIHEPRLHGLQDLQEVHGEKGRKSNNENNLRTPAYRDRRHSLVDK